MSDVCAYCGQTLKLTHKETLTHGKLHMLRIAANHVKETMNNDVSIKVFNGDNNLYNNFQKLRYHGLVHHFTKNGERIRGHWLITKRGWGFLRGDITMPKFVLVKNNAIVERSTEEAHISEVDRLAEPFETSFQYFDDDGNPVGMRPSVHIEGWEQASLL